MTKINAYEVYRLYAIAKNRYTDSFMRAGSIDAFRKRRDKNTFSRMIYFFRKNEITTKEHIDLFFSLNAKRLGGDFYPHNLLTVESLECYGKGKQKYGSIEDYFHFVFRSFKFVNDFCDKNEISVQDYFKHGKISQALKHLKEDKIAEDLIVFSRTIDPIKAKTNALISIFARDFLRKYKIIEDRIKDNSKLEKILDKGFQYLIKQQKSRNSRKRS